MKLRVLILGYGEMGHAMEYLLNGRHELRIWDVDGVKDHASTLEQEAGQADVVLFCLPVNPHLEIATRIAPLLRPDSLCITIAKGLDEGGRTAAQVFEKALAERCHYGVMYGPMISEEIRLGRYAFADVVLSEPQQFNKLHELFQGSALILKQTSDMHGRAWSVILKNVYAIMFGISDELGLGDNMRGHLMVTAISELSEIVQGFGGEPHTPYSYAGLGDLLTTATSEDSHHHALGRKIAHGDYSDISGEGVHTLAMVAKYQLFDWKAYPLFALAQRAVSKPAELPERLAFYLEKIRQW
ncbi:MAG TPA: hypothetical protein VIU93_02515 [Gallionellaceae bacterium]